MRFQNLAEDGSYSLGWLTSNDFNSVSQAAPCHMSCQCVAKVCNRAQMH